MPILMPKVECASRDDIHALQLARLKEQVAYVYDRVCWYRERMDEMGVRPEHIKTLDDVRLLPFTDKKVMRDTYPFGLFAEPVDDAIRLHASSGTTGKPVVVGYDRHDMDVWAECIMRLASMAGVTSHDRAQMAFGYGMFTGGFGLHQGLEKLGCLVIPAGSGSTERQIMMIEDYKTTVLIATPTYALHICEIGEKLGHDWAHDTLRVGLFGGEPCTPAVKAEIESRMHITCTDNYGLTEVMGPGVAGECLSCRDHQHIAEDHFLWEVVDPDTGEVLPEGEEGELVLTTLTKKCIPVLRYRTHDYTYVTTEPCGCGRTLARMKKVRRRSDDMLIIRGTNVFPSQIEDVLSKIEGASPNYRLVIDNPSGMDRMTLMLEVKPDVFSDEVGAMDCFRDHVAAKLRETLQVSAVVKLVEPGSIERTTGKAKHVQDLRVK